MVSLKKYAQNLSNTVFSKYLFMSDFDDLRNVHIVSNYSITVLGTTILFKIFTNYGFSVQ